MIIVVDPIIPTSTQMPATQGPKIPDSTVSPAPPKGQVDCGDHLANTCSECPQGLGEAWCNGECKWKNYQCVGKNEWQRYDNFCESKENVDLHETGHPEGNENIAKCMSECSQREECTAIEWYESGRTILATHCYLMLSDTPAYKGSTKKRYLDATCYIRPFEEEVACGDGSKAPTCFHCPMLSCNGKGNCKWNILGIRCVPK